VPVPSCVALATACEAAMVRVESVLEGSDGTRRGSRGDTRDGIAATATIAEIATMPAATSGRTMNASCVPVWKR
jgi:hypothetical protein